MFIAKINCKPGKNNEIVKSMRVYKFIIMIIILSVFLVAISFIISLQNIFAFAIEILATLLGVYSAFYLERISEEKRKENTRRELLISLKEELERGSDLLNGRGNLLPTDTWSSAVSSGNLMTLKTNERIKLRQIYEEIKNHNYEAKMVRELGIQSKSNPKVRALHAALSKRLIDNEERLKEKIDNLLKELESCQK